MAAEPMVTQRGWRCPYQGDMYQLWLGEDGHLWMTNVINWQSGIIVRRGAHPIKTFAMCMANFPPEVMMEFPV